MAAASWHTAERFQGEWTLDTLLGKGVFGQVYAVKQNLYQRVEAVKVLNTKSKNLRQAAKNEAKIWRCIGEHKNIVKLHEIYEERDNLFLVMEKCDCHILKRLSNGFRMRDIAPLFKQMLTSIAYLHKLNIVHRDIKLENFLCTGSGLTNVKLCDFGFAAALPLGGNLTEVFGTPPYMSPEMLMLSSYNAKTDVWSAGVGLYFLLSGGKFPYEPEERTSSGMKKAIVNGSQLTADFEAPKNVTSAAKQFAITLMNRNATTRLTAEAALQHPFFWEGHSGELCSTPSSDMSTTASEQGNEHDSFPSECEDIAEDIAMPAVNIMAKRHLCPQASKGQFKNMPSAPMIFEL